MDMKILVRALIVAVVALVFVTGVAVHKLLRAEGPPIAGAVQKFKPDDPRVPVPPVQISDDAGHKFSLAAFKGKFVLLNVWATWCAPCVEEMPSLDALKQEIDGPHLVVVTVSEDHGGKEAVDGFFAQHGLTHLTRDLDPDATLSRVLQLAGLPTTLLIDPNGIEIGRLDGRTDWSSPDARKLIDYYVARYEKAAAKDAAG